MEHPPSFDDGRPQFDLTFARDLIGKHVLVGVTVEDRQGAFKRQEQFHGVVTSADPQVGIMLSLLGTRAGQVKRLPPDTRVWQRARKGVYSLRSTGEDVVDPDFTAMWVLKEPDA